MKLGPKWWVETEERNETDLDNLSTTGIPSFINTGRNRRLTGSWAIRGP